MSDARNTAGSRVELERRKLAHQSSSLEPLGSATHCGQGSLVRGGGSAVAAPAAAM